MQQTCTYTRDASRLTTPNALTARSLFVRPPVETVRGCSFPRHAAAGEAAVGLQMQQRRHLRKKVLRRQGLLGNNGLSCSSSLCAARVCLHVWAPRRLELRALNGNINANQPFNLYKRNRGRRGRRAAGGASHLWMRMWTLFYLSVPCLRSSGEEATSTIIR